MFGVTDGICYLDFGGCTLFQVFLLLKVCDIIVMFLITLLSSTRTWLFCCLVLAFMASVCIDHCAVFV